jgi:imidazolonepropionase-like amidohydrolase
MQAFKAKILYDGKEVRNDVYVVIEGDKIVEVKKEKPECEIIEAEVITPAFIDGHSHIGLERAGEPLEQAESNDISNQIQPLNNPLNSLYFDDKSLKEAVEFGVLYSVIVPGSGNVLGGKAVVIRNFGKNRTEGFLREIGYKLALGYNPRSTVEWKGIRPSTRMGVYALLEKKLDDVKRKIELVKLEKARLERKLKKKVEEKKLSQAEMEEEIKEFERREELKLSLEDKCLKEILEGKKILKVHVHKGDDILYLIELKNKFNFPKVVAEHLCDVHTEDIFKKLKENEISLTYGPLDAFPYKIELKHESYKNVEKLVRIKPFFCLMSDHPATLARNLFLQSRFFLYYGVEKSEVIKLLTFNTAKINGIDDLLGSIEKGKLASFVLWDKDPFSLEARPFAIVKEGEYEEIK